MDGARSTYAGRGEANTGVWSGNPKDRGELEHPDEDGRIMLKWMMMKWCGGMDWIYLARDRGRWRHLVNAAMNLRIP
jgi:hypothetical protein